MGIYSRDYIRDSGSRPSFSAGGSGSICKKLIIANIVVFVLQLFFRTDGPGSLDQVSMMLSLSPDQVLHGQVWRLLTYAFCHSTVGFPWHILFNMLFLWWFGRTLEAMYGSREFLLFYLTAALVAGLAFVTLGLATGRGTPAIGASGAVMAILMVYAIHFPRQKIYIWGIIPVEIWLVVTLYVLYDLWPVLKGAQDGVAHSAHLGGLAFGFLYYKFNLRIETLVSRIKKPRFDRMFGSRRGIKIYQPTTEEPRKALDEQVDAILEKIHKQGEESLTPREREVLKRASDRYKNQ